MASEHDQVAVAAALADLDRLSGSSVRSVELLATKCLKATGSIKYPRRPHAGGSLSTSRWARANHPLARAISPMPVNRKPSQNAARPAPSESPPSSRAW